MIKFICWFWATLFLPALSFGQQVAASAPPTPEGLLKMVADLGKALQTNEAIPALVILCNLLVALSKMAWVEALWVKVTKVELTSELTDAGRTFLALGAGLLVVCLLSPAPTASMTLGKGFGVGFAAIGMFNAWKHTLKKVFFKPRGSLTVPPQEPKSPPDLKVV